jgi:TolA-binding protein
MPWIIALTLFVFSSLSERLAAQTPEEMRLFNAAALGFEDGNYSWAERQFGEFIQKFPQSSRLPEAILFQARAALAQQKLKVALDLLSAHLNKADRWADQYRYWLAQAHIQGTNYQAAADMFAQLIKEFPTSIRLLEASYGEAKARFKLGDYRRVIQLLQTSDGTFQKEARARPNDEFVLRGYLLLGEALLEQKDYGEAEKIIERLGERDLTPEFQWHRQYLLCRVQIADQRLEEALANGTNLLALAATTGQRNLRADSVILTGEILEQLHRWEAAVEIYTNNLAETMSAEHRRQALLKIAELTLAQNKIADAAQKMEQFFAQYPQDAASDVALLTLGELQLKEYCTGIQSNRSTEASTSLSTNLSLSTNSLQRALVHFDRLIANFSQSPFWGKAQLNKGWCLWEQGRIPESQIAFKAAAENLPLSDDRAVARFKLADAQFALKDYTNALQNYRSVLRDFVNLPRVKTALFDQALYQILRASLEANDLTGAAEAMKEILQGYPESPFTDRSLLLVGQQLTLAGNPREARAVFRDFTNRIPDSPLLPEVELTVARSYGQEKNWDAAIRAYDGWIDRFATNSLRPRAEFYRARANALAGRETNALSLFTDFVAQFPTNELAPRAQYWIAEHYFREQNFTNAEIHYESLSQRAYWPKTYLTYRARMMAGLAAFARQSWRNAEGHFTALINDNYVVTNHSDLAAEACFALGDTILKGDADPANPLGRFDEAKEAYRKIFLQQLHADGRIIALAWGAIGNCYLQMGAADKNYYTNAIEAYQQVLGPSSAADVSARSQAEIGIGLALERQAQLKPTPENAELLDAAREHYLNVFYGRNVEKPDPFWLKEAGLAAARLAEEQKQWDLAIKIYSRLVMLTPALHASLNRKINKARDQLRLEKN